MYGKFNETLGGLMGEEDLTYKEFMDLPPEMKRKQLKKCLDGLNISEDEKEKMVDKSMPFITCDLVKY